MDATVMSGLNSLNQSIQNATQIAQAYGDSKRAEQMHWDDILWQDKWRKEDKDYASKANRQAYDWTRELAQMDYEHQKEFLEMQQLYNSPMEQIRMLREAGLNPALAFGDAETIGLASSGSHSSPSPLSAVGGSVPGQSGYFRAPSLGDPAQSFAHIAAAYGAISQSKKTAAETKQLEETAADLARKITADADFAEYGAILQREFARGERSAALRKIDQNIAESVETVKNLTKSGAYTDALRLVAEVEKKIKDNDYAKGNIEISYLPAQLRSTIQHIRASAANQSSQARLTDEQRSQLEAMHDFNVRQKAAITQMDEAELRKTASTLDSQIDFILGHFDMLSESDRIELERLRSELKIQKNIKNTWWFSYVFDKVERINNGITNWIPFAPDKTTVTDSQDSSDNSYRFDGNGNVIYQDQRTSSRENTHSVTHKKSFR